MNKSVMLLMCIFLFVVSAWPSFHSRPVKTPRYHITDLGALNGKESEAYGINDFGQVVGQSDTSLGHRTGIMETETEKHAFVYSDGIMRDLGSLPRLYEEYPYDAPVPGHADSTAYAINNRGEIVGESGTGRNDDDNARDAYRAIVWYRGKQTDLGTVPGYPDSTAYKVNAQGQIVGQGVEPHDGRVPRACVVIFHGGKRQKMDAMADGFTINDRSQRFGAVNRGGRTFLVLWQGGQVRIRTPLPATHYLLSADLNNHGVAALSLANTSDVDNPTLSDYPTSAAVWMNGRLHPLATLPGYPSGGSSGINDAGEIVGSVKEAPAKKIGSPQQIRAVLWKGNAVMDLNKLIPQNSGWLLENAEGINKEGQIVGNGTIHGQERAFLLTPTVGNPH